MTGQITADKFRYWVVASYYSENDIDFCNLDRDNSNRYLNIFDEIGKTGFHLVANLNCKMESIEFQKFSVVPVKFFENDYLITAFGELSGDKAINIINHSTYRKLEELHKEILSHIQNSLKLNKEINCPLDSGPILLYMEPLEINLFSNSNPNDIVDQIDCIIKMLGAHENKWSMIGDYLLASIPQCGSPWYSLIFINTKQVGKSQSNINVTSFFLDLIKQLTSYHLLKHRMIQLNQSYLSKFEIQSLISNKSFEKTSELHWRLLSASGQFYDYYLLLTNELPVLNKINSNFLETLAYFRNSKRVIEPSYERWKSYTIIKCFEKDVSKNLDQVEQYLKRLSFKNNILSSFSQDKLNTEISKKNLNLQNKITNLTRLLLLLTFILVCQSIKEMFL